MQVLDQGTLSNFSCGQRMAVVFVGMTLLQAALLVLLTMRLGYSSERMYGYGFGYNATYKIETLDETPFFSRKRLIGFAIWSAIVATVAIVCMLSRTETMIGMDSNFIVETSCVGPFAAEFKLDRAKATVRHVTEVTPWFFRSRRYHSRPDSGEDNYLAISQPDRDRSLYIELAGRENSKDLINLAPEAMRHYAAHLRDIAPRQ
ncbi:hypothetical protein AB4Z52_20810 [Rhizobium sp. 2YAF20]|uniref:hypothetical protein n=1 Tax=Rhizobium sp. 2YAF20 TaxID=3233027 RepID=UPI003F9CDDB8